jgi:hypothetical protein
MFSLLASLVLVMAIAAPAAAAQAYLRPLSDWLDGQQAVFDPGTPLEFQEVSWFEPSSGENYLGDIDGRAAMWVLANGGADYTPTLRGRVMERVLPDGRALVTVQVWATNAITYVWQDEGDFPNGPELFGYRVNEIADGATPVLGSARMQVVFVNTAPGADLPDLFTLAFTPEEGQELLGVSFHGSAFGPLREASGWPEGTPGMGATQQVGLFFTGGGGATADGFPVEWVTVRPSGG